MGGPSVLGGICAAQTLARVVRIDMRAGMHRHQAGAYDHRPERQNNQNIRHHHVSIVIWGQLPSLCCLSGEVIGKTKGGITCHHNNGNLSTGGSCST